MFLRRFAACLCAACLASFIPGLAPLADEPRQNTTPANANPAKAEPAQAAPEPVRPVPASEEWRTDPACQLVFFAVLEGLYTDGVPDEVVDLIVPPKSKQDVKHCFVFNCPMCHAAYEAFVLYQRRQAFQNANEPKSTFGKKLDLQSEAGKQLLANLASTEPRTRVFAMGDLIRPWIDRRIQQLNLTTAERDALIAKLLEYAKRGNSLFLSYRRDKSTVYYEWQFYGGCQACEAAQAISRRMQQEPKK